MLSAGCILRPRGFFPTPLPLSAAAPASPVPTNSANSVAHQTKPWSPLGEVLERFRSGEHRFSSERNLARLSPGIEALRACFLSGGKDAGALLAQDFQGASFQLAHEAVLRQDELFDIRKVSSDAASEKVLNIASLDTQEEAIRQQGPVLSRNEFLSQLAALLGSFSNIASVELQCTAIEEDSRKSGLVRAKVIFHIAGGAAIARSSPADSLSPLPNREISGEWLIGWIEPEEGKSSSSPTAAAPAKIAGWWPLQMSTVKANRNPFTDVTAPAFGQDASFKSHLLRDTNYWRAVLDSASGIDIFGNCGVSVADVDGDGKDEIYLCQPQGLPNRLYRQKQPGVFEEFAAEAGIDLLDSSSMALFADVLNRGRQDLIVITESAPLLFLNNGRARFTLAREAFPPSPGATSLTGAAMADYDRDGYLDLYVCAYGYFQGQGGNPLPSPYYDAQNGPPNYLYRNRGDGTFADVTEASGLHHGNNRFSFACAWVDFADDGWPGLCVVNDFGRNNFYQNQRNGKFEEVDDGIPGYGSGMSVCAADLAGTGQQDLYVGNMWTPAGVRVTRDPEFARLFDDVTRPSIQQFAMGNALYSVAAVYDRRAAESDPPVAAAYDRRNANPQSAPPPHMVDSKRRHTGKASEAPTHLEPVPDAAGARRGRWAWCSDSFDLENDGRGDLYVANGFLTAPEPGLAPVDVFLWEEVVASSPHSGIVSSPYRAAWTAIFQLAHAGHSWNGNERNVLFLNLGDGQFADISAVSGIDFLDDGRSFAVFDFDGDGDADIILHSRSGPQLRLLRNDAASHNQSLSVRLTGTKGNRDAIGARVEVRTPSGRQARVVTCGSGFLAQHSKELIFGLGKQAVASSVTIRWPSGTVTELENLEAGYQYSITEGRTDPRRKKFTKNAAPLLSSPLPFQAEAIPQVFSAAMIDPFPLPPLEALRGLPAPEAGSKFDQNTKMQRALLWLWSPGNSKPEDLAPMLGVQQQLPSRLIILGESSLPASMTNGTADLTHLVNPAWKADARFEQFISLTLSYLFDYRRKPPFPTGLLIDIGGQANGDGGGPVRDPSRVSSENGETTPRLLKVYWGGADSREILRDAEQGVPSGQAALPFPGRGILCSFERETRTLGAALAQAGLYFEAEIYLALAAASNRKDADTFYNLALVRRELGKADAAQAGANQALALRPDFPEAENLLGVLLIQSGYLDQAEKLFQKATGQSPSFAEAWNNLGYVMLQNGNLLGAKKALERTLQLAPEFPDALNNFGILLARQGNLEKAREVFTRALALQPGNEQAANNLGVVYFHQGKPEAARQTFLTLLEHNPEARSVMLNLAKLDLSLGKKNEARKILQDWLDRHPKDSTVGELLKKL